MSNVKYGEKHFLKKITRFIPPKHKFSRINIGELGRGKKQAMWWVNPMTMDKKLEEKSKEVYSLVNEKANPTSVTFEIELPYTVPKDGKTYMVEIKENEINARY